MFISFTQGPTSKHLKFSFKHVQHKTPEKKETKNLDF